MDPKTLQLLMGSSSAGAVVDKNYIEDVFSTWLYTGNGSTQTITNGIDLSTKGGLTWIKSRGGTTGHRLTDTVRGATKSIASNSTSTEATESTGLTAFTTSGFSIGADLDYNTSSATYVSWSFREQAKFFDIVTYTGNGVAGRAINHNLGSTPGCIIIKDRSAGFDWLVWHRSSTTGFFLNTADALQGQAAYFFGDGTTYTAPTSTTFTVGNDGRENANGTTYVAYVFAHEAGGFGDSGNDNVISCGSYTGNGSTNGTAVTLGWEPQWLLIKRVNSTGDWNLIDNLRGFVVGGTDAELNLNLTNAESTGTFVTPTATGFQLNTTDIGYNANLSNYIYVAIRRGPMKTPTDATKVFDVDAQAGGSFVTTSFPVDLLLLKRRTNVETTYALSRLQGGTQYLETASAGAEQTAGASPLIRFDSNVGVEDDFSASGSSLAYFNFRRAPGFFDVVAYAGSGSARTITHNLGVIPELIFVKLRSSPGGSWAVYTASTGNTKYLFLNSSAIPATSSTYWNNTSPTSTVFSLSTSNDVNALGATYIAYLFASCSGVSKIGSYTGTGTTLDVDCGFTNGARLVVIKRTDSTGDWYVWDTARGIISGNDPYFLLNSTAAEVTNTDYIDPLSSGFQISSTAPAAINASGGTYIYLAIA